MFLGSPYFALLFHPVQNTINAVAHSRRYGIEDLWTIQGQEKDVRCWEGDNNLVAVGWDRKSRANRSHFRKDRGRGWGQGTGSSDAGQPGFPR